MTGKARHFPEGEEAFVRRDEKAGDAMPSKRPPSWDDFFALAKETEAPADFLSDRDTSPPPTRVFPDPQTFPFTSQSAPMRAAGSPDS